MPTADQDVAVTIEATSPTERTDVFARAFGLGVREAEPLRHLVPGSDTRCIAREMFLSEHTIQDHLKSVFAKCVARNRLLAHPSCWLLRPLSVATRFPWLAQVCSPMPW